MSGMSVMLGCLRRGRLQRLLDRPAGRVGDMDDAAVAVPALAGQMQRAVLVVGERHAELGQPLRSPRARARRHARPPRRSLRPGAGDHRVADMRFEAVAFLEHRGDPALRPAGRALGQRALGDHRDLERRRRG